MSTTRILGLDVSTHAGFALLISSLAEIDGEEVAKVELEESGVLQLRRPRDFGDDAYPWSYVHASKEAAKTLTELIFRLKPDVVVIEETNLGKQRYDQKLLEYLHNALLILIGKYHTEGVLTCPVFYLSCSEWRHALGLKMSNEDKRNNKLLKKARDLATTVTKTADGTAEVQSRTTIHAAKKALGVKGKIGWKHLSVRYANEHFGLKLKQKENDEADAICLASAFAMGARPCTGEE
jgi:hypothetical protein